MRIKEIQVRFLTFYGYCILAVVFALLWPRDLPKYESLVFFPLMYLIPVGDFIFIWRHKKRFSIRQEGDYVVEFVPGRFADVSEQSPGFFHAVLWEGAVRMIVVALPCALFFQFVGPSLAFATAFVYFLYGGIGHILIRSHRPAGINR